MSCVICVVECPNNEEVIFLSVPYLSCKFAYACLKLCNVVYSKLYFFSVLSNVCEKLLGMYALPFSLHTTRLLFLYWDKIIKKGIIKAWIPFNTLDEVLALWNQ